MLTVCFEHAPAILVERGGGPIAALMESARIVTESGTLRTWATSVVAHGIQLAPIVIGVALAAGSGSLSSLLWWVLILGPLSVLCLVVGQGMVVSAYLALRHEVTPPESVPRAAAPSRLGTLVWSALLIAVITGPLCVAGALSRPSKAGAGRLPEHARPVLRIDAVPGERLTRYIPDTALSVDVRSDAVRVRASDGGGVGKIPVPNARIARVRVARMPTSEAASLDSRGALVHAIEVQVAGGRSFVTFVDDAGVRLDDSATRRLSTMLPLWAYLALSACLGWTAIWIVRALPPQARLRRRLSDPQRVAAEDEASMRRAFRRRWVVSGLWLVPASASSLVIGLWAALG
jgi:hypothetical protein